MNEPEDEYVDAVRRKAERMARARRDHRSLWAVLAHAGSVGWQLALPLTAGALIGHALAQATGRNGVAVAGLLVGLALGIWAAWRGIERGLREGEEE